MKSMKEKSFGIIPVFKKDDTEHKKFVKYFFGFTSSMTSNTLDNFKDEIPELKWVTFNEARNLITFPEARRILDEVIKYVGKLSVIKPVI